MLIWSAVSVFQKASCGESKGPDEIFSSISFSLSVKQKFIQPLYYKRREKGCLVGYFVHGRDAKLGKSRTLGC